MTSMVWTAPKLHLGWRLPVAAITTLLLLITLAYHETAAGMVAVWARSATFNHAFVVPPITAWLIWRSRARLEPLAPAPAPVVLLPMALIATLWLLGDLTATAAASQFAYTAMLVLCVPLVLGWAVTRALLFPLLFLFFAVPIGEFMTPYLMHWTAEVLVASLRLTGIPVYQEGQQLVIPSGRWAVVEACSGVRYLMATCMVGSLFAYLNYQSTSRRAIFMVVSLVMPVVANWVRAYIIVMLGHLSNNEIATGVDHLVYGWVFFGIVIMGLFFIGARWAEDARLEPATPAAPVQPGRWTGTLGAGLVAAGLAAALWPMWFLHARGDVERAAAVQLRLPEQLGAWSAAPERSPGGYLPHFQDPLAETDRTYRRGDAAVTVYIAYYRAGTGDGKLVSSLNQWVHGEDRRWHVLREGERTTTTGGRPQRWREAVVLPQAAALEAASRTRVTVWRLYWLGDRLESRDAWTRLWQAWKALRGAPSDGAALHLITASTDEAQSRQVLSDFVRDNYRMLQQSLEAAGAGR